MGEYQAYVEGRVSFHQPNSFSESQNFQTGMSANFMFTHRNKGSISLGYTKLQWPTSFYAPASLLSHKEGLTGLVSCLSVWHCSVLQSCPVSAPPNGVVWTPGSVGCGQGGRAGFTLHLGARATSHNTKQEPPGT